MSNDPPQHSVWSRPLHIFIICVFASLVWMIVSGPVLLHTNALSKTNIDECGEYNEQATGLTVLNPLRSRFQERLADGFLKAASKGECSPNINAELFRFVTARHTLPARKWDLMNRRDDGGHTTLFYRLKDLSKKFTTYQRCTIAQVDIERTGTTWNVVGFGITPGPYHGR